MLTKLTVMIISQCIQILNHYVAYLKLTCCISIIPQGKKKKNGKKNPTSGWYPSNPTEGGSFQYKPSKDRTDGSSQWPVMNVHASLPHGLRQRLV